MTDSLILLLFGKDLWIHTSPAHSFAENTFHFHVIFEEVQTSIDVYSYEGDELEVKHFGVEGE